MWRLRYRLWLEPPADGCQCACQVQAAHQHRPCHSLLHSIPGNIFVAVLQHQICYSVVPCNQVGTQTGRCTQLLCGQPSQSVPR